MGEGARQALHPDLSGLFVGIFDRSARHDDLIGAHGRIADDHDLVVGRKGMQHIPGLRALIEAPPVVLPHELVKAVVEVEMLHVLELGARR